MCRACWGVWLAECGGKETRSTVIQSSRPVAPVATPAVHAPAVRVDTPESLLEPGRQVCGCGTKMRARFGVVRDKCAACRTKQAHPKANGRPLLSTVMKQPENIKIVQKLVEPASVVVAITEDQYLALKPRDPQECEEYTAVKLAITHADKRKSLHRWRVNVPSGKNGHSFAGGLRRYLERRKLKAQVKEFNKEGCLVVTIGGGK